MNDPCCLSVDSLMVHSILKAMQAAITKHGLKLMQHYPEDLLVHDKSLLERRAVPGAQLAWMVGHHHTHLVSLGFHPKENMNVNFLTSLSRDDRFFVLSIGQKDRFSMIEISREQFSNLSYTAVPYRKEGMVSDFWLFHQQSKVGHVSIEQAGDLRHPKRKATITPVAGISDHALAALDLWSAYAIIEAAGTLFTQSEVCWAKAIWPVPECPPQSKNRLHTAA